MKVFLIFSLFYMQFSIARPILSQGKGIKINKLLTLYPDHQNKNLFYFYADSSEISLDKHGYPKFSLVYDSEGGFVHGAFKLSISEEMKLAIKDFRVNYPNATLTHMPILENSLEAGVSVEGSNLFANFKHADKGAPIGGETGFSGELTSRGAKLFSESLRGSNPFSLNQCITVSGLSDHLDAHISIDWRESYKELQASFKGKIWIIGLDLKGVVKKLIKKGIVKITRNGGDENDQAYIRKMAEMLIKEFLTPVTELINGSSKSKGKSFLGMKFKMKYESYKSVADIDFYLSERVNLEKKHCLLLGMESIQENYDTLVKYIKGE